MSRAESLFRLKSSQAGVPTFFHVSVDFSQGGPNSINVGILHIQIAIEGYVGI